MNNTIHINTKFDSNYKRIMNRTFIISTLILTLFAQCTKNDSPASQKSSTDIFNEVWNDFDRNYPYFTHKKTDWDSVYQHYLPKIDEGMSTKALADIIGEMTMGLRDIHVAFKTSDTYYHYRKRDFYPENPPSNATNYLSDVSLDNSVATYGTIANSNFIYLRIKTFNGSSGNYTQLASLLDSIVNRDGLIIDIRNNGGGNELNGRTIAGKFVTNETLYKYTRTRSGPDRDSFTGWNASYFQPNQPVSYDKEIMLLTNRGVYSSAELFTLMMKTIPNLTLVGDTTGAASANPASRALSNGWSYYVSTWQAAGLDYTLIEDNGLAPEHYVLMDSISIAEGKDLILEKAVELLSGK